MPDIYSVVKPDPEKIEAVPVVFDSPHTGDHLPDDFQYACPQDLLKRTEDCFVDDLFKNAPTYGASFLEAQTHRSYIDLKRKVNDIDPDLLSEPWPKDKPEFGEIKPTPLSAAGIGLIRRLVKPGMPIYDRDLSPSEIKARIEKYYLPYHKALAELLDDNHYNYGKVWHINCHSMPSSSAAPRRAIGFVANRSKQTDFCLGNRDGTTCDNDFTHALRDFIQDMGYAVTINDPFKGVTLVGAYSAPTIGRNSIQLEINQAIYMDEDTGKKLKGYKNFKQDIEKLIAFCTEYARSQLVNLAAD